MDVQQPVSLVQTRLESWLEAVVQNLPNAAVAIVVLAAGWLVARLARKLTRRVTGRYTDNAELVRMAGTLAGILVILGAGFVALSVLHLEKTVTTLLAGAGVVGLALGFAFQDTAANFISGVAMALRKPFEEGDLVEVGEDLATVERIDLRTTLLRRLDGPLVMIPNKTVFQNRIVNLSAANGRRVDIEVGVSYSDDLEEAKRIAVDSVREMDVLDPERPVDFFWKGFGGSSVDGTLRFWIRRERMSDFLTARSDAMVRLKRAFDNAEISIPFPIQTLDFSMSEGLGLGDVLGHHTQSQESERRSELRLETNGRRR